MSQQSRCIAFIAILCLSSFVASTSYGAHGPSLGTPAQELKDIVATLHAFGVRTDWTEAELTQILQSSLETESPSRHRLRTSEQGRPLLHWVIEPSSKPTATVLALATIHGDELSAGYWGLRFLIETIARKRWAPNHTRVVWIALANPDGFLHASRGRRTPTRENIHGVDLNRNFLVQNPEPETAWLKQLLKQYGPSRILSFHAPYDWLDYDGPKTDDANSWLNHISQLTGLPRNDNFPAWPGSLGTYAKKILHTGALTWELPEKEAPDGPLTWDRMKEGLWFALEP